MEEEEVALVEAMVVMDCHRNDLRSELENMGIDLRMLRQQCGRVGLKPGLAKHWRHQLPSPIRALPQPVELGLESCSLWWLTSIDQQNVKKIPQPLGQLFTKIEKIMTCPELSYVVRNTQWSNTCHYFSQFTQLWEHVHHFWACQWTSPNCDIIRLLFVWLWPKKA